MLGLVFQHPIMAARANSAAQLKDLGGVSGALSLLESTTHSDGVRESAALALANCTQRDDDVCVALGGVGAKSLRAFVDQMTCTYWGAVGCRGVRLSVTHCLAHRRIRCDGRTARNATIGRSVARAIANMCAVGDEETTDALVGAGVVKRCVDSLSGSEPPRECCQRFRNPMHVRAHASVHMCRRLHHSLCDFRAGQPGPGQPEGDQ